MLPCYILKTKCPSDICQQFDNVKLDENTMGSDYYETTAVAFFPLDQFKHRKSLLTIDKNCEAVQIDGTLSPLNRRIEKGTITTMANIEQQIQELNADIDEVKKLLGQATRLRVKQFLEVQQRRLETDFIALKEKQEQQNVAATAAAEKKPTAPVVASTNRSYTKEITVYAWDQSDKFVKIYVQNLDGVGDLSSDQVRCSFEERVFSLEINNLKNVNYLFKRGRLLNEIKPAQSTFKVKKDMVIISLAKVDNKKWECIFRDEKKTEDKPLPKMDDSKDPGDSLMKLMKNMYETGDDDMKRTIAKAWTESREKMNTGGEPEMPGF
ncbi:unnamed protein product [Rotaria socialis]|uniref:Calcyclin-binding protein n=1 Tax=Rotaria socialis TaxID=392032 RepID=A0A821C8V3_9BILA|nr:unnamed protein product [Rotaria socialis]